VHPAFITRRSRALHRARPSLPLSLTRVPLRLRRASLHDSRYVIAAHGFEADFLLMSAFFLVSAAVWATIARVR
jgi:hypothetical protein